MSRTAGNFWWICFLLFPLVAFADISLRMVDEEGESLKQAQVGRLFTIEVALTNNTKMDASPSVRGLDQFSVQETSWRYEMINGSTTIKHNYKVIAQNPGEYTVGPALLIQNKKQEVSNTIQVVVGQEQEHVLGASQKEAPTLLRLSVNKDHAVKGERIIGTLCYYYTDPSQKLRNFIEQPGEDFNRKKARGPRQGTETVNGIAYDYLELDWDMYPQKTGSLVFPAFGAEYEVAVKRDHMWGGLGRLFGSFSEPKRIYSNAVTLEVDDIPPTDKKVQGVGIFDSFQNSAHPPVVSQGEGAVITVALKGDFDPDRITFPGLQGVPKELRYYESKESVDEPSSAKSPVVKRFEYIVQGLSTGSWEIPAQQFYYYDVATRSYQTLTTAPLSITIRPSSHSQAPKLSKDTFEKNERKPFALMKHYWQPIPRQGMMPWWLFFLFLVIPFFVGVFQKGGQSVQVHSQKKYRARRSYQAFSIATAQLRKIEQAHNSERLYTLFIELFTDKWQVPIASVTTEYIKQRLHDIGMADEQLAQWDVFFTVISEQAFGAQRTEKQIKDLFRQAEQWLKTLKQLL